MFGWLSAAAARASCLEAAQALGVGGEGGGQNLDGDVASEARIAGAIDLAHAACADERDDFVGTDVYAGFKHVVSDAIGLYEVPKVRLLAAAAAALHPVSAGRAFARFLPVRHVGDLGGVGDRRSWRRSASRPRCHGCTVAQPPGSAAEEQQQQRRCGTWERQGGSARCGVIRRIDVRRHLLRKR